MPDEEDKSELPGVDGCRRRPNCRARLFYFDTSTYGVIARGDEGAERLSQLLSQALEDGSGICVGSPWIDDEVSLVQSETIHDRLRKTVRSLTLELRMKFSEVLINEELFAAGKAFSDESEPITWREAFDDDPDNPPLSPFQAQYRNKREGPEPRSGFVDEVEYDRTVSASLLEAHTELREAQLNWEAVAEANEAGRVNWLLGVLVDPNFLNEANAKQRNIVGASITQDEADAGPGSDMSKYLRFAQIASMARHLAEDYPRIAEDPVAFANSDELRSMPTVRLFSYLLAALSVDGRRTTGLDSDFHDLWHLTYGLSRCDVVTADKRSYALATERSLVPEGTELVRAHELVAIEHAVRKVLEQAGTSEAESGRFDRLAGAPSLTHRFKRLALETWRSPGCLGFLGRARRGG